MPRVTVSATPAESRCAEFGGLL